MITVIGITNPSMKSIFLGDLPFVSLSIVQENVDLLRPKRPQTPNKGQTIKPNENIQQKHIISKTFTLL